MGFPTVFIVPSHVEGEKLKAKLVEWKATLVANSARFEPDHPEMATIEIITNLGNQADNPESNELFDVKPASSTSEPSLEQPSESSGEGELQEALDAESDVPLGDNLHCERLVLELVGLGWWFRIKMSRGKPYLCARKGPKERCIGQFNKEMQKVVEENNIIVRGYSNRTNTEPP
jgi:hypothetical protein